ncbi:MarR family winged helix-turn-helix transcriptional regulator [Knoellia sp. Soil729]|uniref:MarR family winged helix-turn-helix transcriptional regulator n=1 Tax=Knoellia sp. Soil729 TaxID=1736394 RepID=UPI0006F2CD21|nr:MarR family transcriptional regulator [Knoellia sp. Soil729]KRE42001.1 MarR family transcriptional regulator [Knoellia sp. Soil729]
MPKDLKLPFDPIARAGELWRARWGEDSEVSPMVTATSIMRVQQLLLGKFDAIAGRHGLTFARYEALVLLAFSREGRLSMGRIGERLMVHPTSATNIVQRLAAQGFVERVTNPADRRGAFAVITDTGRGAMEATTADLEAVEFGLGMLEPEQQAELFSLLRGVRVAAGDFLDTGEEPAWSPVGRS